MKLKKTISLFLALILASMLAVPALALDTRTIDPDLCTHQWRSSTTTTYTYNSVTSCKKIVVETRTCSICKTTEETTTTSYPVHDKILESATCNGTTQTIIYSCKNCRGTLPRTTRACPGAGKSHANGCLWLPV